MIHNCGTFRSADSIILGRQPERRQNCERRRRACAPMFQDLQVIYFNIYIKSLIQDSGISSLWSVGSARLPFGNLQSEKRRRADPSSPPAAALSSWA
eukprot:8214227-Pyramimonas_sp.AAC.1